MGRRCLSTDPYGSVWTGRHAEKQDKEFKYNEAQLLNYLRTIEIEIALLFK